MNRTRRYVVASWRAVEAKLSDGGEHELARDIRDFVDGMPPVQTDKTILIEHLLDLAKRGRTRAMERAP